MKNTQKKIILFLLIVIICLLCVYLVKTVYGLFESNSEGIVKINTGKWKVILNKQDISEGVKKEFVIDSVKIEGSKYVKEGKFAPGMTGTFDIELEAQADTAIQYDITFDPSKIESEGINITSIKAISNEQELTKTGENTYTKIYTLAEAQAGIQSTIKVSIEWQNSEEYNENDTKIGITKDYKINIPIDIQIEQYLGKTI